MDDGASEAELRDDEVICPVTHLTYYHRLPHSPHYTVNAEGKVVIL